MTAPSEFGPNRIAIGIGLTIVAGFLFATLDTAGKQLMYALPAIQVVWGRYFAHTLISGGYLAATTGSRFLKTRRPLLQLVRSLSLLGASVCVYLALPHITLAEITSLVFLSPLVVTLLSVIFLGERIGPHRIVATCIGFAGALLIMGADFGDASLYHLMAFCAAFLNATYLLLTRLLSYPEEFAATQFNTTAIGAVILSVAVIPFWQPLDASSLAFIAVLGMLAALGHFTLLRAFSFAPASLLSPYLYVQIMFATLYSVLWFGDPLHWGVIAGAPLLVCSGLYIWWRERTKKPAR